MIVSKFSVAFSKNHLQKTRKAYLTVIESYEFNFFFGIKSQAR
jgi:hypothetical protein